MEGYFINPEGNLGHPVAYTHTQIHLYTSPTYIHKSNIHTPRENILTQSVSRYRKGSDPTVHSAMILTVSVSRRKVKSEKSSEMICSLPVHILRPNIPPILNFTLLIFPTFPKFPFDRSNQAETLKTQSE